MPEPRPTTSRSFAVTAALVVLGLGLLVRLAIACQPPERLLPVCLADDTFYYLRIAENVLAGQGSTFDGHTATNGYHPLWMLVSLGAVKLAGSPVPAARVLVLLLALIGAGNAYLVWRLARGALSEVGALWAAAVWSLSPFVIFTELMGVEAPLMMLLALAALLMLQRIQAADGVSIRDWAVLGGLLGLALLARTDAILLALPLAAAVGIGYLWPVRSTPAVLNRRLTGALIGAGVSALVVAPWVLFNINTFGSVAQDSARALLWRERAWWALTDTTLAAKLWQALTSGFADYLVRLVGLPNAALVLGLAGLLLGAVLAAGRLTGRRVWEPRTRALALPLAWGAVVWAFYVLYFWQQKFWYLLPVHLALALVGALAVDYLARAMPDARAARRAFAVLSALLLLGFGQVGWKIWTNGYQPWQRVYVEAATYVRQMHVMEENNLTVGAFNAGILSAWSGLPVVNLDGVVNPDATRAMQRRDLLAYLRERGVDVLVDHQRLIAMYGAFGGPEWANSFTLVKRFDTPTFSGDVMVLRLKSE